MNYSIPLSFVGSSKDIRGGGERWVHSYAQVIRFSASIYLPPLRIRLDEDQEGLLLVYDDFLLCLTEDPIYETNLELVDLMTAVRIPVLFEAMSLTSG